MSAENRARIAFGLLILVGTVTGFIWYYVVAGRYTTFEVRTGDPVSGLMADAPVEFHGVPVGTVKQVDLVDPHSVKLLLSVRRDAPITTATVATITTRGLAARGFMGYAYVALEDVGTDSRPLTPQPGSRFPVISAAPSRSLTMDARVDAATHDVQELTDLLHSVLDRNTVASLKESLDELQALMRTLTAHSKKLDAIIENAQAASTNAAAASRRIKPLLESSQEAVEAMQTEVLPEADQTLAKLHELSNSLNEITAEIERDPSVLVRGRKPPPPGPGEKK
jgi:phospholipid/cholesterol/gamma-HCH transport system substrate-binding protein